MDLNQGPDKYVCTTYVAKILKDAGYEINKAVSRRINMTDVSKSEIKKLLEKNDPKIKGVVTALVESGQGKEISIAELQPGDLVQWWTPTKTSGFGHVVIVKEVLPKAKNGQWWMVVHGSHYSKGGVTDMRVQLLRKGGKPITNKKFFCVRPLR